MADSTPSPVAPSGAPPTDDHSTDEPSTAPRWSPRSRAWAAVTAACVLALAAAALVLGLQVRHDDAAQRARAAAGRAAQQQAVAVTSVSSTDVPGGVARVLDQSTGSFRTAYEQQSEALGQTVREQQVTSSGRVVQSAVTAFQDRTADVLVLVEARVANRAQPDPTARRYRMQLGMQRVGSQWLTSSLQVLDGPAAP